MVALGLLLGAGLRWATIGGGLGFSLAGILLLLIRADRQDALDRVGTGLVAGGIAGMVLAACLSVSGAAEGADALIEAVHSMALTAALSGAGMRIFAWATRYDQMDRVRSYVAAENGELEP